MSDVAENTNTTPNDYVRLVPMSREQRHDLAVVHGHEGTVGEVIAAWDAAADPAEAVRNAISSEWMNTGMGNEERIDDVYDREGAAIYRTRAVLVALGLRRQDNPTP